jgi:CHASE3 domain sensor protein
MHMSDLITGIGTAQQSYVAPGQLDEPWFERTTRLTSELSREIGRASNVLRAPEASDLISQLRASVDTLTATDGRTRQNLQLGQDLMASDVIFSDGRNLLDAMSASLRSLETAERSQLRATVSDLTRQRWITLGVAAALWIAGLLTITAAGAGASGANDSSEHVPQRLLDPHPQLRRREGLDLAAAATICTDLSRITTTSALPGLLGRAAGVLDASGLILWISAGDQLFAVLGHGYDEEMLARLGPIEREAENAAATAWRTGQMIVVPATATGGRGAIIVPLFGLHSCIGVLSVEVRHSEDSPAVKAVATMIAAQLSTVVPAWPTGSLSPAEGAAAAKARTA